MTRTLKSGTLVVVIVAVSFISYPEQNVAAQAPAATPAQAPGAAGAGRGGPGSVPVVGDQR